MHGSIQSQAQISFAYQSKTERTFLAKRQAGGLCSLSKPYWNELGDTGVLSLQLVNPTAGLFSGDSMQMNIHVGAKAQAALTSPSATRFHTMPHGQARITQQFTLEENTWLDYWPEIIIPQRDSDVIQTTKINLTPSSNIVFFDSLAPGRIAHEENYQFRRLETRLEIYEGETLLAKERCVLAPGENRTNRWPLEMPGWDNCYYGAIWITSDQAEEIIKDLQSQPSLTDESTQIGISLLADRLGVIRILAPSSLELKKTAIKLRQLIESHLPLLKLNFRKL